MKNNSKVIKINILIKEIKDLVDGFRRYHSLSFDSDTVKAFNELKERCIKSFYDDINDDMTVSFSNKFEVKIKKYDISRFDAMVAELEDIKNDAEIIGNLFDSFIKSGDLIKETIMKQSELKSIIKECYSELLKEDEKPISSQIGVFNSDGTVETIKLLNTESPTKIKHLLKQYYPTYKLVQALLDYGAIVKLDKTVGKTLFAVRDKKIRSYGNKLKGDFKSFVTLVKKSGAQYVFLYDLKNKEWNWATIAELPYFEKI